MAHLGPPSHVEVWSEEQEFSATVWGWCKWLKEAIGLLSSTWGQSSLAKSPLDPILSFFSFKQPYWAVKAIKYTSIIIFRLEHQGLPSRSHTPWACPFWKWCDTFPIFLLTFLQVSITIPKLSLCQARGTPFLWVCIWGSPISSFSLCVHHYTVDSLKAGSHFIPFYISLPSTVSSPKHTWADDCWLNEWGKETMMEVICHLILRTTLWAKQGRNMSSNFLGKKAMELQEGRALVKVTRLLELAPALCCSLGAQRGLCFAAHTHLLWDF